MSSMAEKMQEKAISATDTKVSKEIVKTVSRADVEALNRSMKPIIEQNHQELRESWEEMHDKYVGTK